MRRPAWVRHWPPGKEPKCNVCGETDEWKLRYYLDGFRCDEHAPKGVTH